MPDLQWVYVYVKLILISQNTEKIPTYNYAGIPGNYAGIAGNYARIVGNYAGWKHE